MTSPADDAVIDHRLGTTGCRCGWEEQAAAFRWSGELRALVFPPDPTAGGLRPGEHLLGS